MSDVRGPRSDVRGPGSDVGGPTSEVRGPDDRFDRAIDGAVREMLDVEPRADLRAHVLAGIDARPARFRLPAPSFQFPVARFQWFAALAGAAALLVLAIAVARRSEPPAQTPVVAHASDQRLPADAARRPRIDAPAERVVTTAKSTVTRIPTGRAYAASSDTTDVVSAIDPLKTITPIEVAPIERSSIAPEPIAVRPLSPITEMQIAPLNPPGGRD